MGLLAKVGPFFCMDIFTTVLSLLRRFLHDGITLRKLA